MSDTFAQRNNLALDMICLLLILQYLIIKMKDGSEIFYLGHLFTLT